LSLQFRSSIWENLRNLRSDYVESDPSLRRDYWRNDELLAAYDQTLGERIGWKWRAVIHQLAERGLIPWESIASLTDWGCGSGKATETLLAEVPLANLQHIFLFDRSKKAMQFSEAKLSKQTKAEIHQGVPQNMDLLLISHVANELCPKDKKTLHKHMLGARYVIWVEPGTPASSRELTSARQKFLKNFKVLAPCLHQDNCPLGQVRGVARDRKPDPILDWCHQFARPPAEVFHSSFWAQVAKNLRIDIASLPLSFLVLKRRDEVGEVIETIEGGVALGGGV
jgi:hypothetical protein